VEVYRRIDTKRNRDRDKHQYVKFGENIKEYQRNNLEYILRMPPRRIPRKIFDYLPVGRRERSTTEEMER
jgi:hypothetical protein